MKGKYFTKIILAAFIAAGLVCIAVGLIVYFTAKSSSGGIVMLAVGVCTTAVGILDTLVTLMALLLILIKGALEKRFTTDEVHEDDKNDNDKKD